MSSFCIGQKGQIIRKSPIFGLDLPSWTFIEIISKEMSATESVQCFGRKRHAVAVAHCKRGSGLVRVNGAPVETVQPAVLRYKVLEPLLLLGKEKFANVDIRVRVRGGGFTSQVYGEFTTRIVDFK